MVLRSISHLSEYRTFHGTYFFYWEGIRVLPVTSLWGLYTTPILQYNKNTRKAYPIISIALRGREIAFKRIGIFFRCSSRKKINKYNKFWSKLLKKRMLQFFSIHFFLYEYCLHIACIFVWDWSVGVRYENYLPPFC